MDGRRCFVFVRSGEGSRVLGWAPGSLQSLCRCNRCLQPWRGVGVGLKQSHTPLYTSVQCSFFSCSHTTFQMLLRSSFKSFGDTYIFIQPNSKAKIFLLNFEIMLISPAVYPCFMLTKAKKKKRERERKEKKAIQDHVNLKKIL